MTAANGGRAACPVCGGMVATYRHSSGSVLFIRHYYYGEACLWSQQRLVVAKDVPDFILNVPGLVTDNVFLSPPRTFKEWFDNCRTIGDVLRDDGDLPR